jgi:nucleotide-binding universal stress UspA family protein
MRVLLAIHDSESSAVATQMVMDQAQPGNTEVLVLTVMRPPNLLVAREMVGYDATLENAWEKQEEAAKLLVESVAAKMRATGAMVSCSVELGDPRTKILEIAGQWRADLIVMGSDERTRRAGYLPSGIPEAIARRAHCSVEIVRSPQREIPELV